MLTNDPTIDNTTLFIKVKEASLILRAINNKIRQVMLKQLEQHLQLTVTEIMINLKLDQSSTSQHLAILRRSGLVLTKRQGKQINYELNYVKFQELNNFLASLLGVNLESSIDKFAYGL